MKMDFTIMKGKVARRIFLQFVLCSLVPIAALAVISFTQVKGELENQGRRRLHQASRSLGTAVYDRLTLLENDLNVLSLVHLSARGFSRDAANQERLAPLRKRFKALAIQDKTGSIRTLFGKLPELPRLSPKETGHLRLGKALVLVQPDWRGRARLFMAKQVDSTEPGKGLLYGEIDGLYLWGLSEYNTLPASTELAVLDSTAKVIFSTHPSPPQFYLYPEFHRTRSTISRFEWEHGGQRYQSGYWSVFMRYHWFYPKLTVVLSSPKEYVFAPIAYFRKIFPLVILLALWIVILLSAFQISKTTRPLLELKESSNRIAKQDFESRVNVRSGDEFEELGDAFNNMAKRLGKQFHTLTAMADIDRAILSSLRTEEIIEALISGMKGFFDYDLVSVSLFDQEGKTPTWQYRSIGHSPMVTTTQIFKVPVKRLQKLMGQKDALVFRGNEDLPGYLELFREKDIEFIVLLPLLTKKALAGIIVLGSKDPSGFDKQEIAYARQIADQVAIALSNARLLKELDELNWGTLYALARAVDAKSPWTANHSERVTEIALKIGKAMGLNQKELDDLARGGLLHDIGKLAIPAHILDKNGALSQEELETIRSHPEAGSRILEPIAAYRSVVPLVLQHHEHFDGTGYPSGIAGNRISRGARILTVADVYDALSSKRPYRNAKRPEEVLEVFNKGAGRHFDPQVVSALFEVIEEEGPLIPSEADQAPNGSDTLVGIERLLLASKD
ncbi:MAG: HD domain-containing protein [Deltaproteobacteria bacterium]|nr:HD domain-containing protein [Deltaproteobacteria bacterium]MBW2136010.1 HD domain-containing protein [Deltaproteobacteria bacterium]